MSDGPAVPRSKAKDKPSQNLLLSESASSFRQCEWLEGGMRFYSDRAFAPCTQLSLQICMRQDSGQCDLRHYEAIVVGCELFSDTIFQILVLFLEIEPPRCGLN